jgi:2-polyprenyl-6-methoxyphenol hydroxylase-like FAD-dependent oxidoreductase
MKSFDPHLNSHPGSFIGSKSSVMFGHELRYLTSSSQAVIAKIANQLGEQVEVTSDFLIACDGANSKVRSLLNIKMEGTFGMQHLMSVHFSCPGLRKRLSQRSAMLYFVFHQVSTT